MSYNYFSPNFFGNIEDIYSDLEIEIGITIEYDEIEVIVEVE